MHTVVLIALHHQRNCTPSFEHLLAVKEASCRGTRPCTLPPEPCLALALPSSWTITGNHGRNGDTAEHARRQLICNGCTETSDAQEAAAVRGSNDDDDDDDVQSTGAACRSSTRPGQARGQGAQADRAQGEQAQALSEAPRQVRDTKEAAALVHRCVGAGVWGGPGRVARAPAQTGTELTLDTHHHHHHTQALSDWASTSTMSTSTSSSSGCHALSSSSPPSTCCALPAAGLSASTSASSAS
jgi:hypothetical protein